VTGLVIVLGTEQLVSLLGLWQGKTTLSLAQFGGK
jgi:hypothetical protein